MAFSKFTAGQKLTSAQLNERLPGWVKFDGDPVTVEDSHNVASISDLGVGNYQINWDDDFANTTYAAVMNATNPGVGPARCNPVVFATASTVFTCYTAADLLADVDRACVIAFGART